MKNFAVSGGSKRGWTTWLTATADPRVIAIAPIVIDMLNLQDVFIHQWESYGYWEEAAQDYVNAGIMNWLGTPQMDALQEIIDPYRYRQRLTMPKYLVSSTGDQFFPLLPDDSQSLFQPSAPAKEVSALRAEHGPQYDVSRWFSDLLVWFRRGDPKLPAPALLLGY